VSPRAKVQAGGVLRKSLDTTWRTPEYLLERARFYFGGEIPFDPATSPNNPTRARRFCAGAPGAIFAPKPIDEIFGEAVAGQLHTVALDALARSSGLDVSWDWPTWVNPPFAKEWIVKIGEEAARGSEIVALLGANRFETDYLQATLERACSLGLHRRRVKFISSIDGKPVSGNPYPSMLVGFNVNRQRFAEAFKPLGLVLEFYSA
jgi:hypothetical protein